MGYIAMAMPAAFLRNYLHMLLKYMNIFCGGPRAKTRVGRGGLTFMAWRNSGNSI